MEERLDLHGGEAVLLVGPAKAIVLKGEVEVFGRRLFEGNEVVVKKYRAIPLESLGPGSTLKVTRGLGGGVERRERIGCGLWKKTAEEVVKEGGGSIIVGKADSGKSSLTVFLLNRYLEEGVKVGVVDADVGQGDIGEPGLIGAAVPRGQTASLEEVEPFRTRFIGKTSPHGMEGRLEEAVSDLRDLLASEGCKAVLVTLHGWISGDHAARHILRLVEKLDVGRVVFLRKDEELEHLIRAFEVHEGHGGKFVKRIFADEPNTYRRSPVQRRRIRERKIRSYLEGNDFSVRSLVHGEVPIQGTGIFRGEEVDPEDDLVRDVVKGRVGRGVKVVYCEGFDGRRKILVVDPKGKRPLSYERRVLGDHPIDIYTSGREMGLISGFRDEAEDWRMGKLLSVRPLNMEWFFLVPKNLEKITSIILGRMVVDEENMERRGLPKDFFA